MTAPIFFVLIAIPLFALIPFSEFLKKKKRITIASSALAKRVSGYIAAFGDRNDARPFVEEVVRISNNQPIPESRGSGSGEHHDIAGKIVQGDFAMAGLLAIGKIAIKGASLLFDAAVNAANKPPEDPPKTQRQRDLEKDLLKWAQRHARTLEEIERMKSLTVAVFFFGLIILAIVVSRTHYM